MRKFSLFAAVAVTSVSLLAGDLFAACGGGRERGRLLGRLRERRGGSCSTMSAGYSATYSSRVTVSSASSMTAPIPPKPPQAPVVPKGDSGDSSGWKQGPLPPGTWNWGGVVLKGMNPSQGFLLADFAGDHVKLYPSGKVVKPEDVDWYNNSLTLPPRK